MGKVYIHYGSDMYDPGRMREKPWPFKDKPTYGLWGCDINEPYGWKEWSEDNDFHTDRLSKSFKFKLRENTRLLEVHKIKDICKYTYYDDYLESWCLNFQELSKDFDALELFIDDDYNRLHYSSIFWSWDINSIVVWNPDSIIQVD